MHKIVQKLVYRDRSSSNCSLISRLFRDTLSTRDKNQIVEIAFYRLFIFYRDKNHDVPFHIG